MIVNYAEYFSIFLDSFFFGIVAAIAAVMLNPLQYLKVMRQETGLTYQKIIVNSFKEEKVRPFFRGWKSYAIVNFISSSSFGLSVVISDKIIKNFLTEKVFMAVLLRILIGGILETTFTFKTEISVISQNKGELDKRKLSYKAICMALTFVTIRNGMAWTGAILGEASENIEFISSNYSNFIALITGCAFGILTIPFDAAFTRSCDDKNNTIKDLFFSDKQGGVMSGSLARVLQIGLFSVVTLITMRYSPGRQLPTNIVY